MKTARALFRVERGHPDDVELAALTTVLLALSALGAEPGEAGAAVGVRWWRRPDAYTSPGSWR
ncbi:acyl-CoA carboxylase subunit epsilon [Streptomyces sp. NPDC057403]|uniref:acyl-CoA carboxylase subunit epsilon n=1 Tax=Streptomyces sp. NPDC057403 TaxID=3346119 RepID=UPI0036958B8B